MKKVIGIKIEGTWGAPSSPPAWPRRGLRAELQPRDQVLPPLLRPGLDHTCPSGEPSRCRRPSNACCLLLGPGHPDNTSFSLAKLSKGGTNEEPLPPRRSQAVPQGAQWSLSPHLLDTCPGLFTLHQHHLQTHRSHPCAHTLMALCRPAPAYVGMGTYMPSPAPLSFSPAPRVLPCSSQCMAQGADHKGTTRPATALGPTPTCLSLTGRPKA